MTYDQSSVQGRGGPYDKPKGSQEAAEKVKRQAQENLENTRERAASDLDSVADAVGAAAENLRDHHQEGLSSYVAEIAESVSSVASSLRHKSVDELIHQVEGIARHNPTLFLAGSLAVGLGIGRFARASAKHGGKHQYSEDATKNQRDGTESSREHYFDGEITQRVTEEDYLADDFAMAGGDDLGLEGELAFDDDLNRSENARADNLQRKDRQFAADNRNQPIGGDFYE